MGQAKAVKRPRRKDAARTGSGWLDGLRVIEVAHGVAGPFCGVTMTQLGARVIKVEPPEGDLSRRLGPFPKDIPHPEKSAIFHTLNRGKESITLDLQAARGRQALKRLVSNADVVISDHRPSERTAIGLDFAPLHADHPRLTLTSITTFGQKGPYAEYKGYDVTASAAGGFSIGAGLPDREPLAVPYDVCDFQGGQAAFCATMMALLARDSTGEGQHVDIATEEVLSCLHMGNLAVTYIYRGVAGIRAGHRTGLGIYPRTILPCKDGHVSITFLRREEWFKFVELMGNPEWSKEPRYQDLRAMSEKYPDEADAQLLPWLARYTKQEIFAMCQERHIPVAPVLTIDEVATNLHLRARGLFSTYTAPGMPHFDVPRLPWLANGEGFASTHPAPRLGQHTQKILQEFKA